MPAAMRRLARHLFTFASVLSLLLCVAVCVMWVRSDGTSDSLVRNGRDDQTYGFCAIRTARGGVEAEYVITLDKTGAYDNGGDWEPWEVKGWRLVSSAEAPELRTRWSRPWRKVDLDGDVLSSYPFDWPDITRMEDPAYFYTAREEDTAFANVARRLVVRSWVLATAFAVLPAVRAISAAYSAFRRRRRISRNRCPACGYDLRASPERCPECGTPAKIVSTIQPVIEQGSNSHHMPGSYFEVQQGNAPKG
jgi:hypothetical protein